MFNLRYLNQGGESLILNGDIPGENVVVKIPLLDKRTNQIDFNGAIEETHMIEFFYDWLSYRAWIVEPREELLICKYHTR